MLAIRIRFKGGKCDGQEVEVETLPREVIAFAKGAKTPEVYRRQQVEVSYDFVPDETPTTVAAKGILLPLVGTIVRGIRRFSLNRKIKDKAKEYQQVYHEEHKSIKASPLASERYLLTALVLALVTLTFVRLPSQAMTWPFWLWHGFWCIVTWLSAPYRLVELGGFVLGWLFVDRDKLHSVRRSLLGFLLNSLEISAWLVTLGIVVNVAIHNGEQSTPIAAHPWETYFQTLADLLTFSPPNLRSGWWWGLVEFWRFGLGVFLVLCAVSSLAGNIVRRTVDSVDDE